MKSTTLQPIGLFIVSLLLISAVYQEPFFWDTIQLGAMHGDWFFTQNLKTLLLPQHIDSGHIPAFGWYLAAVWKVFGQNLSVSHFAMLPWVYWVLFGLYRLVNTHILEFINRENKRYYLAFGTIASLLLFLADPVLISQLTLISPDVILVGAFLSAVHHIQSKNKGRLSLALCILGLISLRGIMVITCLFIWQFLQNRQNSQRTSFVQLISAYIPSGLIVVIYFIYHWYATGWIGVHDDSPWAASFAIVGISGLIKQIAVLIWRILDFGRIFLWLGLSLVLFFLYKYKSNHHFNPTQLTSIKSFALLASILLIILGFPAILSAGLSQHRYFLPFFIIITLLFLQLLVFIQNAKWRYFLWLIVFIGLSTGNLWVYPDQIAQGWDSTLRHKSYFHSKNNVKKFLSEENIIKPDIGTQFPEIGSNHYRYLDQDQTGFSPANLATQNYILYSNVMNDFTDEELIELEGNWDKIYNTTHGGVKMILYKKR